MKLELNKVEHLLELIDLDVDLTQVIIPSAFFEAKSKDTKLPEQIVMRGRSSVSKFSGIEVLNMVNTIDHEIGRLLTIKKNMMGTLQDTIDDYEEKKQLESLS